MSSTTTTTAKGGARPPLQRPGASAQDGQRVDSPASSEGSRPAVRNRRRPSRSLPSLSTAFPPHNSSPAAGQAAAGLQGQGASSVSSSSAPRREWAAAHRPVVSHSYPQLGVLAASYQLDPGLWAQPNSLEEDPFAWSTVGSASETASSDPIALLDDAEATASDARDSDEVLVLRVQRGHRGDPGGAGESDKGAFAEPMGLSVRRNGSRHGATSGPHDFEPITSDPDAPGSQHLPTARRSEPSKAILSSSQRWAILLFFLQLLSIVPAFFGTLYCAKQVWSGPNPIKHGDGVGGIMDARSTRLDYFAAGVWAFASGYWCWSLASGLLRRWLVYYEFIPALVRLLSLQAIIWPLTRFTLGFVGWDQPVLGWLICGASSAVSNTIQLYVTSNIRISASDKPASWSQGVPQLRASARKYRALNLRQAIVRNGMPLAMLAWATLPLLLWEVYELRWSQAATTRPVKAALQTTRSDDLFRPLGAVGAADVRVLVLVVSSWTERSFANREIFRNSSLRLLPSDSKAISFRHRFVIGEPPSPFVQQKRGLALETEMSTYQDVVHLPTADGYNDLSKKMHSAFMWSSPHEFDFLLKTDDDMFVRFDTLGQELASLGRRQLYWKGLGYWNIPPIHDSTNKNAAFDYDLPLFPPFTAGALYILSRDVVSLVTADDAPRRFTQNEDQALGIWLYPFGIRPIHDQRIQQAQVCEDDMIAKHFGSQYKEELGAVEMYQNVVSGKRLCEGFLQKWCGICYPSCRGRSNHWREWGFECDDVKGVTLLKRPGDVLKQAIETPLRSAPDAAVLGGKDDPWIIQGLLSQKTSTFSATDDWHLLHMLCWTTDASTFQERHWQLLETVWVHEPRAVIFMLSSTLPLDFFQSYSDYGYDIHVVRIGSAEMIRMGWYLGPESRRWLERWDQWSTGPYFFSHLTDYLRFVFLYKYGGTYMDMDAPWVRSPPDSKLEFIGADFSTVASDVEWTLDDTGMYLAPGVLRFRKGWEMFREIGETNFVVGRYRPECFNCVGPRAITGYVKTRRRRLEEGGLTILENRVLYPKNWVHAEELVRAKPKGEGRRELEEIIKGSWSIHLFGKMTNHIPIEASSTIAAAMDYFSLFIPHPRARLSSSPSAALSSTSHLARGLVLSVPGRYTYRSRASLLEQGHPDALYGGSLDGAFEGLDAMFVQAAKKGSGVGATVEVSTREGSLAWGSSSARVRGVLPATSGVGRGTKVRWEATNASMRDVNVVLGSVRYGDCVEGDAVTVKVVMGGAEAKREVQIMCG